MAQLVQDACRSSANHTHRRMAVTPLRVPAALLVCDRTMRITLHDFYDCAPMDHVREI